MSSMRLGALLLLLSAPALAEGAGGSPLGYKDRVVRSLFFAWNKAMLGSWEKTQGLVRFMVRRGYKLPDLFEGPRAGEPAPDFALKDLDGKLVRLADFKGKKPVVLVLGSYSCPIYRWRTAALEELYARYRGKAAFFVLYTVESHPKGSPSPYSGMMFGDPGREGAMPVDEQGKVWVKQPASHQERTESARRCREGLKTTLPVLVDEMDDSAWTRYGRAPNAAYLIDAEGTVRLRQGWLEPAGLERALEELSRRNP